MEQNIDVVTKNLDCCEKCGNRFDFPEEDLLLIEVNGVETFRCYSCGGDDAF